jgi:hypothetical protein
MAVYSDRKIRQISYPWGENSPIIPAIRKEQRPSPNESPLRFEVDWKPIEETLTAFQAIPPVGFECIDDLQRLRGDAGLADLIGHDLPSPSAALQFLYAFHGEEKIAEANQQRWPEQMAYIPEETAALEGLGEVNGDPVRRFGGRVPGQRLATVDQDGATGGGSASLIGATRLATKADQ